MFEITAGFRVAALENSGYFLAFFVVVCCFLAYFFRSTSVIQKKNGRYDDATKMEIAEWAINNGGPSAAGKHFGINESTVRGMVKWYLYPSMRSIKKTQLAIAGPSKSVVTPPAVGKKRKGPYGKYDAAMRADIAKFAIFNGGPRAAATKFGINESTVRGMVKAYKAQGCNSDELPRKKRGGGLGKRTMRLAICDATNATTIDNNDSNTLVTVSIASEEAACRITPV